MATMENRFKNIANKTRRKIVSLLMDNKKGLLVADIKKMIKMTDTEALLSHHLKILKDMKIVSSEKEGQHQRYLINRSAKFIEGRTLLLGTVSVKF